VAERESEVAIYEEMLAADPRNRDARGGLLVAETELGDLSLALGNTTAALAQLRRATGMAADLLAGESGNAVAALDASAAYASLGDALQRNGERDDGRASVERARALVTPMVERDPTVVRWQTALAEALLFEVRLSDADPLEALRKLQGIQQRLSALQTPLRSDRTARLLLAQCFLQEGERRMALGDRDRATIAWSRVVELSRAAPALTGPKANATLAAALQELGRDDEAMPLVRQLQASGYRDPLFAARIGPGREQVVRASGRRIPEPASSGTRP
jgi:tetratricopeptide (TPR) repeat protein